MSTVPKVGVRLGFNKWSDVIYAEEADMDREIIRRRALLALYRKYPSAMGLRLYPYVMASSDSNKKAREFMYVDRDRRPGTDYVCFHAWRLKRDRDTIVFSVRGVADWDSPHWEDIPIEDARAMWPWLKRQDRYDKIEDTQRIHFNNLIQGENHFLKVFCK